MTILSRTFTRVAVVLVALCGVADESIAQRDTSNCPDLKSLQALDSLLAEVRTSKGDISESLYSLVRTFAPTHTDRLGSARVSRMYQLLDSIRNFSVGIDASSRSSVTARLNYSLRTVASPPPPRLERCDRDLMDTSRISGRILENVSRQLSLLCALMQRIVSDTLQTVGRERAGTAVLQVRDSFLVGLPRTVNPAADEAECTRIHRQRRRQDTTWVSSKAALGIDSLLLAVCRNAVALSRGGPAGSSLALTLGDVSHPAGADSIARLLTVVRTLQREHLRDEVSSVVMEIRLSIRRFLASYSSDASTRKGCPLFRPRIFEVDSVPWAPFPPWPWSSTDTVRQRSREYVMLAAGAGNQGVGGGILAPLGPFWGNPAVRGYFGAFGNIVEIGIGPEAPRLGFLGQVGALAVLSYDRESRRMGLGVLTVPPIVGQWRIGAGLSTTGVASVVLGRTLRRSRITMKDFSASVPDERSTSSLGASGRR
jgi:hypothetical protein